MEAMAGLLLTQTPDVLADNAVVSPIQISASPIKDITGFIITVIICVVSDLHPVDNCVNINLTFPALLAMTKPEFEIEAIVVFVLSQVPLLLEENCVDPFMQIESAPVNKVVGLELMFTTSEVFEVQKLLFVNVKVTEPD
jgi:hypothetical protein